MTLPLERARSRRPVTWLTVIGVMLLPVVIGGILVAALYNPTERLDAITAAVVNDDEPVTIDDQLVPLGRQLTSGLVEGSDELDSNLTWVITNDEDAATGLADGAYAAVITIPENFSAAATSTQPGETPERAVIEVQTPPDSRLVDDAITAQVAQAAAAATGQQLSEIYLENVFLGFTTLGDQLGDAADGAGELADGAGEAADGAISLADGIAELASGAGQLAGAANQIGGGASEIATGAGGLADGAGQLADGAALSASGLQELSTGASDLAAGMVPLNNGLTQIADGIAASPQLPSEVVDAANALAANSAAIQQTLEASVAELGQAAADCAASGTAPEICAALDQASLRAQEALPEAIAILGQSDQIAAGVEGIAALPQVGASLQQIAGGYGAITGGINDLAAGANDAAGGLRQLSGGANELSSGAGALASGANTFASGANEWAAGTQTWAAGAGTAATGARDLGDGIGQLADGTDTLASGLAEAADALPSYTDSEATDLASVVADPVSAEGTGTSLFGAAAVPLLATLALWFGGVGTFIALQAVSRRALTSRAPSAVLAGRQFLPAAGIGAVQGFLVAAVVQTAASYTWGEWAVFAGVCVVAGIAFAAMNQALVAVFGGAGRWVAALVGVLAVATGIVSTIPGVLADVASLLPTAPAYAAMLSALTPAEGLGAGIAGLVIWAILAFIASTLAVVRKRTTSARAVLAEA